MAKVSGRVPPLFEDVAISGDLVPFQHGVGRPVDGSIMMVMMVMMMMRMLLKKRMVMRSAVVALEAVAGVAAPEEGMRQVGTRGGSA